MLGKLYCGWHWLPFSCTVCRALVKHLETRISNPAASLAAFCMLVVRGLRHWSLQLEGMSDSITSCSWVQPHEPTTPGATDKSKTGQTAKGRRCLGQLLPGQSQHFETLCITKQVTEGSRGDSWVLKRIGARAVLSSFSGPVWDNSPSPMRECCFSNCLT